jgi:hypothetical protein
VDGSRADEGFALSDREFFLSRSFAALAAGHARP